ATDTPMVRYTRTIFPSYAGEKRGKQILAEMYFAFSFCQLNYPFNSSITKNAPKYFGANFKLPSTLPYVIL
ncbi:hypothetical protein KSW27_04560, partial [Holdemanella biformis]|uniref:hypothetical protein n=1 Tax=Holdemanella biformis TaxID=1735 RepID=UPI001C3821DA